MLNPTVRMIWLIDRTLDVSGWGTPSSTSVGMIAVTPPTPKPRTVITARIATIDPGTIAKALRR